MIHFAIQHIVNQLYSNKKIFKKFKKERKQVSGSPAVQERNIYFRDLPSPGCMLEPSGELKKNIPVETS